MFTGIIHHKATVKSITQLPGEPLKLVVALNDPFIIGNHKIGDSIAVNGTCLSIVAIDKEEQTFAFQAIEQTCTITTLALLKQNDLVHIEPSLASNDKIDGHYVSGHVDQKAAVLAIRDQADGSRTLFIENLHPHLVRLRGSIAINGVSLTISDLTHEYLCVSLIPITLAKTNLGLLQPYNLVNLEYDLLLKSIDPHIESPQNVIGKPIISDAHAMRIALALAQLGRTTTPPNPWVGCVIVKDNIIIGAGYHQKAGSAHAEIEAIKSLSNNYDAQSSTMYVTLEPCCHQGRTGPCTEAIIQAQIKHVVIGMTDPDTRVSGKGVQALRSAGIEANIGVEENLIKKSMAPYIHHRTTGKPFVIAKAATSIDGKIAAHDGSSQWITDQEARTHAHQLRAQCQAILVGNGTILKDNPQLTVRLPEYSGAQPLRVILDSHGVLCDPNLNIFDQRDAATCIFTSNHCNPQALETWNKLTIEHHEVPMHNNLLDLNTVYKTLGSRGIMSLLIEGGSNVLSHCINQGLFDELHIYPGNVIIGTGGIPIFNLNIGADMHTIHTFKKKEMNKFSIIFEKLKIEEYPR